MVVQLHQQAAGQLPAGEEAKEEDEDMGLSLCYYIECGRLNALKSSLLM